MEYPKVTIKFGKLIDPFLKDWVRIQHPEYVFPTEEEVQEKVKLFRSSWEEAGVPFMDTINEVVGLTFKRNIIDCFIVSATPKDMSSPLIIRSRYNAEEFVDMMYHELLHILFSDNKLEKINGYEKESDTTINHIDLFALLTYFYKDILNDEARLRAVYEKSSSEKNRDYRRAWEIVEHVGYREIIADIKKRAS